VRHTSVKCSSSQDFRYIPVFFLCTFQVTYAPSRPLQSSLQKKFSRLPPNSKPFSASEKIPSVGNILHSTPHPLSQAEAALAAKRQYSPRCFNRSACQTFCRVQRKMQKSLSFSISSSRNSSSCETGVSPSWFLNPSIPICASLPFILFSSRVEVLRLPQSPLHACSAL